MGICTSKKQKSNRNDFGDIMGPAMSFTVRNDSTKTKGTDELADLGI